MAHLLNVAKSLDDEHQSLLVVAHSTQEEHHFRDEIALLAYPIRLNLTSVCMSDVALGGRTVSRS